MCPQAEAGWSLWLPRALWLRRGRPLLGLWVIFHSTGDLAASSLAAWSRLLPGDLSQECLMALLPQSQEGLSSLSHPRTSREAAPGRWGRVLTSGHWPLPGHKGQSAALKHNPASQKVFACLLNKFQIHKRFWHLNRLLGMLLQSKSLPSGMF